eukprot:Gb_39890 [translate_table: standard]
MKEEEPEETRIVAVEEESQPALPIYYRPFQFFTAWKKEESIGEASTLVQPSAQPLVQLPVAHVPSIVTPTPSLVPPIQPIVGLRLASDQLPMKNEELKQKVAQLDDRLKHTQLSSLSIELPRRKIVNEAETHTNHELEFQAKMQELENLEKEYPWRSHEQVEGIKILLMHSATLNGQMLRCRAPPRVYALMCKERSLGMQLKSLMTTTPVMQFNAKRLETLYERSSRVD